MAEEEQAYDALVQRNNLTPVMPTAGTGARGQAPVGIRDLCSSRQKNSWIPAAACPRAWPGGRYDGVGVAPA
jgi:hypothetical protein